MKKKIAYWIATSGGIGLLPKAPGTFGSAFGLLLAFFFETIVSVNWMAVGLLGLTVLGVWAAARMDEDQGTQDSQKIVVDEVIGVFVATAFMEKNWKSWIAAFVLFRFFDITKIPPVKQVDSWSKQHKNFWWRGVGVVFDDVLAGIQTAFVLQFIQRGLALWI